MFYLYICFAINTEIMNISKIIGVILILLSVLFLGLQSQALEVEASGVKSLALLLLTVIYLMKIKNKNLLFLMFLIFFTIAEIFNYVTWIQNMDIDPYVDYYYYIGNALYILAYTFLITRIITNFNMTEVLRRFPMQILLLLGLGVFVVYLVTDTTKNQLDLPEYALEFTYNAVIMVLLSVSFLNYMYRDDKKSMNLLVGSIFILFSEILQLAYFYIAADFNVLNLLCSVFIVAAFLFYFLQSRLKHEDIVEYDLQERQADLKA